MLKDLRVEANLTQQALAKLTAVNIKTIGRFELGQVAPRADHLRRIADALADTTGREVGAVLVDLTVAYSRRAEAA